jgi:hypothetical protein
MYCFFSFVAQSEGFCQHISGVLGIEYKKAAAPAIVGSNMQSARSSAQPVSIPVGGASPLLSIQASPAQVRLLCQLC